MTRSVTDFSICLVRITILIVLLLIGFVLSSCYTVHSLALEARCGIGRDYVCAPIMQTDHMEMVCGCMDKEDLKAN
jgi:hypothetical protein